MKKTYIKKTKISHRNIIYLLNNTLCKEHKKTLSFYKSDYHALHISGYFKGYK